MISYIKGELTEIMEDAIVVENAVCRSYDLGKPAAAVL